MLREAVALSVTNSPVSACSTQASMPVTTPARVIVRRSHAILGAEKYGLSGSPVSAVRRAASGASSAQTAAERPSCHTIAGVSGVPSARSHASTVSPWLATPTASTVTPAAAIASRPDSTTEASSCAGSCSTDPPAP